jgi:hypothetical protein
MHGEIRVEVCFLVALALVVRWSIKVTITLLGFYLEDKSSHYPPDMNMGSHRVKG